MGRKRKIIADNPISRNLYSILQKGNGFDYNIGKLIDNGIDRSVINSWINGRRQPQIASLKEVAKILNLDVYIILSREQPDLLPDQKEVCELAKRVRRKDVLEAAKTLLKMGIEIKVEIKNERPTSDED